MNTVLNFFLTKSCILIARDVFPVPPKYVLPTHIVLIKYFFFELNSFNEFIVKVSSESG